MAPLLPALLDRLGVLSGVRSVLDAWFALQCERDPARMLGVGAVCARCLGIYSGLGLGALIARPRVRSPWLELWLGVAALAMLADVESEAFGLRRAMAPLRLATGLFLAYPAALSVVRAVSSSGAAPRQ
jgi:uncharacterized membrane protein